MPASTADEPRLDRALDLVRFLRRSCPWDAEQTPESLIRYLVEETFEVVAAIRDDEPESLRDELGDLLLNLAFQVVIAEERGRFNAESVVSGLERKMRRRHPHLYGDGEKASWEELKRREGSIPRTQLLSEVPGGLEPLLRALRLQEVAAQVGFDWREPQGALRKLSEEVDELNAVVADGGNEAALREELGDVLFSAVNAARLLGVSPTEALEGTNRKFERRFAQVERGVQSSGREWGAFSLEELDQLWDQAKESE